MSGASDYPVRVDAELDAPLSRWFWLVKWLLLIPHYVVLALLWLMFVLLTVVALVAIVATSSYPRGIFDVNVGVLRWTWRVQYYAIGAFGTDRYPPFTLADDPSFPARLEIDYPQRLSRGLALVKWWLLAIPQYIVVGVFTGGGFLFTWRFGGSSSSHNWPGLIGLLALIAAVVLLATGRYPRQIFDLLLGLNRWVLRVAAYAALMTDKYPPFRLDLGGQDPGSVVIAGGQPTGPTPSQQPTAPAGPIEALGPRKFRWLPGGRLTGSFTTGGAVAGASAVFLAFFATPAMANPATSARYQPGASATSYIGLAFDTCTAPPLATIQAWNASPYRALGVYIGGVDRHCSQPELTASWVASVSNLRWRLMPIYKGLQAPCGDSPHKIIPASASSQGSAAADDAIRLSIGLGMLSGSAMYYDMEAYPPGSASCRATVLTFLSGWTTELHRLGYVSGIYAQLYSGAADLTGAYGSTSYARPDALWIARYDGNPILAGWAGIADSYWSQQQRAKQYQGGHDETYGGITLNIDNDQVNGPVATIAHSYRVTSATPLSAHSGPGSSYLLTRTYAPGARLPVSCQARGQTVGTTRIWDKLTTGRYVTDYYVSTLSKTAYTPPLQRCTYPFQVTVPTGLSERRGPGPSYPSTGKLPNGALAWVTCQRAGAKVGTTAVWDRLTNGRWVTDFYTSSPNKRSYSRPVPRC